MSYKRPRLKAGDRIAILRPGAIVHAIMYSPRVAELEAAFFPAGQVRSLPGLRMAPLWSKAEGVFYLRGDTWGEAVS
jgi:hypothetical protein